jgi:cell division protein FtsQ
MREVVPQIAPDEVRTKAPEPASKKPRAQAAPEARKGPGPSKISYRLTRAWAKPAVRNLALVYLPLLLLAVTGWRIAADDRWRGMVEAKVTDLYEQIAARPEFAVRGVVVLGGSPGLQAEVRETLNIQRGMSSLKFDVDKLRLRVEALGAVEQATVQFDPKGTLRIAVVERIPVVLFRRADGALVMLDPGGVEIGHAGPRADHPDLPVILGPGADQNVGEVLALMGAASEIVPRLRAFVRVGERRWDIVLDRDMLIKLPASGSVDAMGLVMALHYGEELLDRDLAVIDMRLPERPALRMTPEAAETYQIRKAVAAIGGEDT